MAISKSDLTLEASASNAAGATKNGTGVDLTGKYGATITGKITNGGTGPTVACRFRVEISHNNTDWYLYREFVGDTVNSSVNSWSVDMPLAVQYARSVFTGNTGQAVTVESFGQAVDSI